MLTCPDRRSDSRATRPSTGAALYSLCALLRVTGLLACDCRAEQGWADRPPVTPATTYLYCSHCTIVLYARGQEILGRHQVIKI